MPIISVIVPVYNVEQYIRRCVDSILSQTFTDFELILVDDGSPDNCPAICDEYALKDERIYVVHQENSGLSAARNAGIDWSFKNSKSQWISFVDSDDWIHQQYLELLYSTVKESNAETGVCLYSFENDYLSKPLIERAYWKSYNFESFFCLKQTGLNTIIACGKLYKKELFRNNRYPIGKINEDLFVTPKVLYKCNRIAMIDAVLYFYFQSDDSIMRKAWSIQRLDEIEASENLISFFQVKQLYKAEKVAIRRFFWVLDRQKNEINAARQKNNKAIRYLNRKYRKALFKYRKMCLSPELRYIYEKEYPKTAWCYWTCVGIIRKIKKTVKNV